MRCRTEEKRGEGVFVGWRRGTESPELSLAIQYTINSRLIITRRFPVRWWYHIDRAGSVR